ncbi:DUF58 domain-containing protein [Aestuariimicrobium soli]|uniref:DUF58 domain-containing protein n=1 Tax=Aestuariimicrobium soli TaxID=2035834 RepID=UPI003EB9B0F7
MVITGRAVLAMLVGIVPCVLWPTWVTALAWTALVLVLVALDAIVAPSPRRLVIEREPTAPGRVDEPTSTSLLVTNTGGRRRRGMLRDAWQPSAGAHPNRHRFSLPAGERERFTTPLLPRRRGDLVCRSVTIRVVGPLGLAARQVGFDTPGLLRALPAFPSRKHLPSRMAKLQQLEGRALTRTRGQGTEFDSLRDYVEGDDVRSIDWRATARKQNVVVRTWRPERDRRLMIVLDTSRVSAGRVGDVPRLDTAMDAVQLLSALAVRAGDRVDLLAGDREVLATVKAVQRPDALPRITQAMSQLEPALVEADWTRLGSAIAEAGTKFSLLVLITPLEPAAVEESLAPALQVLARRHRVVVASVSDDALVAMSAQRESAREVYQAAAAEDATARRQRTSRGLQKLGVTVLDEPPATLPVALADHYLGLKSRGLL